jgi:hypothetical protein
MRVCQLVAAAAAAKLPCRAENLQLTHTAASLPEPGAQCMAALVWYSTAAACNRQDNLSYASTVTSLFRNAVFAVPCCPCREPQEVSQEFELLPPLLR